MNRDYTKHSCHDNYTVHGIKYVQRKMVEPTKKAVLVMCGSLINENAKKKKKKSTSKNHNKEVKKVINLNKLL